MLFKSLQASSALDIEQYADIDQFRESERYVKAESIPLAPSDRSIVRARLAFPSSVVSLVRTFPRIIKGYDLQARQIFVIPMDHVASTRVNGEGSDHHSIILFKGNASCTVYEPEGRLVAIISTSSVSLTRTSPLVADGHLILRLQPHQISNLQGLLQNLLQLAGRDPGSLRNPNISELMQASLFESLELAMRSGQVFGQYRRKTLAGYKKILDRVDATFMTNPTVDATCKSLADEIGVSVRTLQAAVQSICGAGIHRYGRFKRLWSVRTQLRTGAPGLTVKASALANGFWHMGEFSGAYRATFGESPSQTLAASRRSETNRFWPDA